MAGPTRRQLLLGAAAAAALPGLPVRAQGGPKRLLVIVAAGGWDPTFVFEPRVGDPDVDGPDIDEDPDLPDDREATRTFGDVTLAVNDFKRPAVSTFFERWIDRSLIVNGIWTGSVAHSWSMVRMLTGTADEGAPDLAVITGAELGATLPLGTIDLSGRARPGALAPTLAKVGHRGQILSLLQPESHSFVTAAGPGPAFVPAPDDADAVQAWLRGRADRLAGQLGDAGHNAARFADWHVSQDRAGRLVADADQLAAALELGVAPSPLDASLLGIDLLQRGVCASVMVDTLLDWDTHSQNVLQHGFYDDLFTLLDVVMDDLQQRAMLDDTLVCVLSEMTRTPLLAEGEGAGKGHWPHATALLLGGPVSGGRVIGGYDAQLQSVAVAPDTGEVDAAGDLLTYDRFVAAVLRALDVDADRWLPGAPAFGGLNP